MPNVTSTADPIDGLQAGPTACCDTHRRHTHPHTLSIPKDPTRCHGATPSPPLGDAAPAASPAQPHSQRRGAGKAEGNCFSLSSPPPPPHPPPFFSSPRVSNSFSSPIMRGLQGKLQQDAFVGRQSERGRQRGALCARSPPGPPGAGGTFRAITCPESNCQSFLKGKASN